MASASAPNRLREDLSSMANGPTSAISAASAGSAALRWRTAFLGSKANSAMPFGNGEQRAGGECRGALDLEDTSLDRHATGCREAAHLAVGTEHAMTGHDDGDRVAAHRLADLARFV